MRAGGTAAGLLTALPKRYALRTQAYSFNLRGPVPLDELRHGLALVGKTPDPQPILAMVSDLLDQAMKAKALSCTHERAAKLVSITIKFVRDHLVNIIGEGLVVQSSAVIQVGDEDTIGHQIDKVSVCERFDIDPFSKILIGMGGFNDWITKRERRGASRRMRPALSGNGRRVALKSRGVHPSACDYRDAG